MDQHRGDEVEASARRACAKCKELIDAEASVCPHCRTKNPFGSVNPFGFQVLVSVLILAAMAGVGSIFFGASDGTAVAIFWVALIGFFALSVISALVQRQGRGRAS